MQAIWVVSWIVNSRAMGWHLAGMDGIPDSELSKSFATRAEAEAWADRLKSEPVYGVSIRPTTVPSAPSKP
jgi:hypothetical protein